MNLITQVRRALIARLETLRAANGYLSDAGADVRSGWFNEVIEHGDVGDAVIVVQRSKGLEPKHSGGGVVSRIGFTVVAAVRSGLDDYEDALEALELDLVRCLISPEKVPAAWLPKGATTVHIGAPEPMPPGNGLAFGAIALPIHITSFIEAID